MRYVVIRNTAHNSGDFEKRCQAWAAIFHNMMYEQGVIGFTEGLRARFDRRG